MSVLVTVALEYLGIYLDRDGTMICLADSFPFTQSTYININAKRIKKDISQL